MKNSTSLRDAKTRATVIVVALMLAFTVVVAVATGLYENVVTAPVPGHTITGRITMRDPEVPDLVAGTRILLWMISGAGLAALASAVVVVQRATTSVRR